MIKSIENKDEPSIAYLKKKKMNLQILNLSLLYLNWNRFIFGSDKRMDRVKLFLKIISLKQDMV